jgi:hypothetical protein
MATEVLPLAPGRTRRPQQKPQPKPEQQQPKPRPRITSPRHTRPFGASAKGSPKAPFLVLLVGLLGGALVSLLVISTTLDEGSYQINTLIQENNALAKEQQNLQEQVANDKNPATIAQEAAALGMVPDKGLSFLSLQTGKISNSAPVSATP